MSRPDATLEDRYSLETGQAFMSGIHALVRLPMNQVARDRAAGLNTGGLISGYRGSPLGGYDQALWAAAAHLQRHNVVFQPGVNEELAANAVAGTQQLALHPENMTVDGAFGIWYGKGPGVDRCSDVFKHANMAGTSRHGGVIAVAGDDHVAKSSSVAHQSDHIFKACGLPVFFPASVQEILDLGVHALALSRFSGVWAGMKTIQEVVESSATVDVDPHRVRVELPQFAVPPGGLHIRWPDPPLEQEARLMNYKWYAALAYIRANRLNYNVVEGPDDVLGIIASGKAYNDTRQALLDLGLDDAGMRNAGIRLHKVSVVWPLEAQTTREFATGLREILVVEEKRQVIEYQLKEELYNWREDVRPDVLGKFDEPRGDHTGGEWSYPNPSEHVLLRANADLDPSLIARAVASRMAKLGLLDRIGEQGRARVTQRVGEIARADSAAKTVAERPPWYCSGCPHSTSTVVPEGSRALSGIGCHYMAIWMDRSTDTVCPMGGEGVGWVGQSPFTREKHVFVNLGDGTYFHSGFLAIRQALAAGVNATYKILYNDAVAMTGGQPVEGSLSTAQIAQELHAEGVRGIAVVTDDVSKYHRVCMTTEFGPAPTSEVEGFPEGTTLHDRHALDAVQRAMRERPGVTVIIYDQACATEKRRKRKRGLLPEAPVRTVINEAVCEGCGDCSRASNCLSVEPVETELGRKRRINQSSCNQDLTCVDGFCPSFVTVEGARPKAKAPRDPHPLAARVRSLPEPHVRPGHGVSYGIVVAGIGGTGVITMGQLLGTAAHIEGLSAVTQDCAGLAQKGGATWSHVQIARAPEAIRTTKVSAGAADLVLACDAVVSSNRATTSLMDADRTRVVLNTHRAPTAAFVQDRDWEHPEEDCEAAVRTAAGAVEAFDATGLAARLMGDAIYANPLMLGYAWQKGLIPLSRESIERAMELNGAEVQRNVEAFGWGRVAARSPESIPRAEQPITFHRRPDLGRTLARNHAFLEAYHDRAWADEYMSFVAEVDVAEHTVLTPGPEALTRAVADSLFRLMSYKDEYEVARLLTDPEFERSVRDQFDGELRVSYNLAPPFMGERKRRFGPWLRPLLAALARCRRLRGTWADPFGYAAERREERALIAEYKAMVRGLLDGLTTANARRAVELARAPEAIRGYGRVKAASLEKYRQSVKDLRPGSD